LRPSVHRGHSTAAVRVIPPQTDHPARERRGTGSSLSGRYRPDGSLAARYIEIVPAASLVYMSGCWRYGLRPVDGNEAGSVDDPMARPRSVGRQTLNLRRRCRMPIDDIALCTNHRGEYVQSHRDGD